MRKGTKQEKCGDRLDVVEIKVRISRYLGLELQVELQVQLRVELQVELLAPLVSWKTQELEEDEKFQVKVMPTVSVNKRGACAQIRAIHMKQ